MKLAFFFIIKHVQSELYYVIHGSREGFGQGSIFVFKTEGYMIHVHLFKSKLRKRHVSGKKAFVSRKKKREQRMADKVKLNKV